MSSRLGLSSVVLLLVLVAGCPMTTVDAECGRYCAGFESCFYGEGERCTAVDEGALHDFCIETCSDLADELAPSSRDEAVQCLDCLDETIDTALCTSVALGERLGACSAECDGVPLDFAVRFGERLNAVEPPLYTCAP